MKRTAAILCAVAILPPFAYAVQMASQPWTTNRIAEAEARMAAATPSAIAAFAATGTVSHANTAEYAGTADRANLATEAQVAERLGNPETSDLRTAGQIFAALDNAITPENIAQYAPPADMTAATNYADYAANAVKTNLIKRLTDSNADDPIGVYMAETAMSATSAATADNAARADQAGRAGDATFAENLKANGEVRSADEIFSALDGIPPPVDTSYLATKAELSAVSNEASVVYRLYSGSNVVCEVTNYNSQVHAPSMRLLQLTESNTYITVWTETNGLARTLKSAKDYTDEKLAELPTTYAPRAWSRTTSGLGEEAPPDTTWLSTPTTVIAGGYEPAKYVTSGGAIWIITANGMAADFSPATNNTAYLNIAATDGTPMFRIEKTDSFLIGVNATAVSTDGNALIVGLDIVAADHPLVRVRQSLTSGAWEKEEDGISPSLATVTWSGSPGTYSCRISNNTGGSSLFAYFEYLQEGGTKIINEAVMDASAGILCTDGVHKCRPVYNNGSITWEVVP